MIVGLFIRHFKVYQGVNYISICDDYERIKIFQYR